MTGTCTGEVVLTQTGQEKLIQEPSVHQPKVFRFPLVISLGRQEKALHQLQASSAIDPGLAGEHVLDHSCC